MVVRRPIEEHRRRAAHALMFALLASTACVNHEAASLPGPRAFAEVDIRRDVVYDDTRLLRLDVYQPRGDTGTARPVLIWVHGGGFAEGNKSEGPLIAFPTEFAKIGYVTLSIDYRLLADQQCIEPRVSSSECESAAAAATSDAQSAVRWVRANAVHFRMDPARIAIAGESAGAITAARVGTSASSDEERVRAWVAFSGAVEGGQGIDAADAPGCLVSNTEDPWIPFQWTVDTAAAMRSAGVPVELKTIEGPGHVQADRYGDFFFTTAKDFLAQHLDL